MWLEAEKTWQHLMNMISGSEDMGQQLQELPEDASLFQKTDRAFRVSDMFQKVDKVIFDTISDRKPVSKSR